MSENDNPLHLIHRGDTLTGKRELKKLSSTGYSPTIRLNSTLYGLSNQDSAGQLETEKKRHLKLLQESNREDRGTLLYNLGCFALYESDLITAKLRFSEAVRLLSELPEPLHNLGYAHELVTERKEAKHAYQRAISMDPTFGLSRVNLSNIYMLENRPEEAFEELRGLLNRDPLNAGVLYQLCRLRLKKPDEGAAREILDRTDVFSYWPEYLELKECRAAALLHLNQDEEAQALFREVLEMEERHFFSWVGLMRILAKQGRWDEMLGHGMRMLELFPSQELEALINRLKNR